MELSLREWIMVASVVGMAAIIGHALWLRWRSRRNNLRLEIDPATKQVADVNDLDLLRGELPNGGARVVEGAGVEGGAPRRGDGAVSGRWDAGPDRAGSPVPGTPAPGSSSARNVATGPVAERSDPDAADAVGSRGDSAPPVLLDPVAGGRRVEPRIGIDPAPAGTRDGQATDAAPAEAAPAIRAGRRAEEQEPAPAGGGRVSEREAARDAVRAPAAASAPQAAGPQAGPARREDPAADGAAGRDAGARAGEPGEEELIVMQVLARDRNGFEVGALTTRAANAGLIFGDFNIFHRYKGGRVQRQFIEYSMANAVEPGVFDLSDGGSRTKGVAFFMQLPVPSEPMAVFDDMLHVASDIAAALDGELRDERHSVITAQTIEHCRERVREFNRRQQIRG